uniref:25 kDa translation elongation factor 1-beta n=1 Tax=Trypanosoma rangeli TaxID=5698 RepID=R9TL19_TRYRA|nr:25 kDa translation elongation factor 1-beta [Trypanosoma rangeli]
MIKSSKSSPEILSSSITISCCSFFTPNATGTSLWSPQSRPSRSIACSFFARASRSTVSSHGLTSNRMEDLAMISFLAFLASASFFFLASRAAASSSVASPKRSMSSSSSFLAGAGAAAAARAGTGGGAVTFTGAPHALRSDSVKEAICFTQRYRHVLLAPSKSLNSFTSSSEGFVPPKNSFPLSLPSSSPLFLLTSLTDIGFVLTL